MYDGPTIWIWQTLYSTQELQGWALECTPNMMPVLDMLMSKLVQQFKTIEGVSYHYITASVQTSTFFDGLYIQSVDAMKRKQALLRQSLDFMHTCLHYTVNKKSRSVYELVMDAEKVEELNSYRPDKNERGRRNVAPHAGRAFPAGMYHLGQERRIPERAFITNRALWLKMTLKNLQDISHSVPTLTKYYRLKTYPEFQERYSKNNVRPATYLDREIKQPIEAYGLFTVEFSGGTAIDTKKVVVTCNYDMKKEVELDDRSAS